MQCVVACGAAVPWATEVGLKRRHVVSGFSRHSAPAAAREFVQFRKHKTTSPDRFSLSVPYPSLTLLEGNARM